MGIPDPVPHDLVPAANPHHPAALPGKILDLLGQAGLLQIKEIGDRVFGPRDDQEMKGPQIHGRGDIAERHPGFLFQGIEISVVGNMRQADDADPDLTGGFRRLFQFALQGDAVFLGQGQVAEVRQEPYHPASGPFFNDFDPFSEEGLIPPGTC